jgi:hypothetical protein
VVGPCSGGATQGSSGAKISYRKNLTVTCQSNAPSNCYCKTGTGKNRGSTYSNVCCQTKVRASPPYPTHGCALSP